MVGWFGDLGRLYWGLLYWNTRKALFRLKGARGIAPCHHPSDSGAAGATGCEACVNWRSAERFRRMCPLLVTAVDGRRVCSVSNAEVRPFWGRACAILGSSAAAAVLLAILTVFAGFRVIGYRVSLRAVAWPGSWHEIQQARADYYHRLAVKSFAQGDVRRSYLALNQAYALDPHNFESDRLLAQLAQIGNPDFSGTIYSRLVQEDIGHAEEDAQLWIRALIERGDFPGAAGLAAHMLLSQPGHASAWAQALLFSERMTGDAAPVDQVLAQGRALSPGIRNVLSLAQAIRKGDAPTCAASIRQSLAKASSPLEVYYGLSRLIDFGRASEVAAFTEGASGAVLGAYDREALKMDAYASLGWGSLVRREIAALLEHGASAPVIELVAAHLVRHPDPETAEYLFQQLDLHPLAALPEYSSPRLSLLCAAGVNRLSLRMRQQGEAEGKIVGGSFLPWMRGRDFFEANPRASNPSAILPAIGSVSLETLYAVFEHYRSINPGMWRDAKAAPP